jgi:O-antigen biosynthesis protein
MVQPIAQVRTRPAPAPPSAARVTIDGKQFAVGGDRFLYRGVTYGTFRPRLGDDARFPDRAVIKSDFASMREAGFTVVRTYTAPPDDLLELAAEWDLRVLAGVFYPDWRYMVGASRRQLRGVARDAREAVRSAARRLASNPHVFALSLGNEIPADVVRWFGAARIGSIIDELVDVVREEDDSHLVTYANYPTAEYLPLDSLDFLTFNVFLEREHDLRRYLNRLHNLAGDRPLVLGEIGLHAGGEDGERRQAELLDWQLRTAIERGVAGTTVFSWTDEWWVGDAAVEGWHFGLTRQDRSPRPALDVAAAWNQRTVADIPFDWPSISVVICAYNAEATLAECLEHTCRLDYPGLEILVVDDGSTDSTADIARRYPQARLIEIPHGGLSVARNEGYRQANGRLVAYLDSDAYPTPEWPYYLALGLFSSTVGGVGGPNLPPADDPIGAQQVARAPGGPVHVLLTDDRAEHVPGCNMAFWRDVLIQVGGFDPVYVSAGDDVDLCWKVLDAEWEIGFHPAALVWHHRRPGLRTYLRQQRGYGRAEALVEARHPDRFTATGSARWRGRIYDSFIPALGRQRVYRGLYGGAAYQSIYRSGGYTLDLLHQVGVPAAAVALLSGPLGFVWPVLALPALVALVLVASLFVIDMRRAHPPRWLSRGRLSFRAGVAAMHLLQPLVRVWGRVRHRPLARADLPPAGPPFHVARRQRGVLVLVEDRPRVELAMGIVTELRRAGMRAEPPTGWEDHDARLAGSFLVVGDLVTSSHPVGYVQVRVRRRLRLWPLAAGGLAAAIVALVAWVPGALLVVLGALDLGRGWWRTGPFVRRRLIELRE